MQQKNTKRRNLVLYVEFFENNTCSNRRLMKKYKIMLTIRMLAAILPVVAGSFLVAWKYYWIGAIMYCITIWLFADLFGRINRASKDMRRLIEAIRFGEMNISFRPATKKGLPEDIAQMMEDALAQFRSRLMQTETDHMFYDTLLQRIDSGIMALNKFGDIEWINKTAVDIFGRPHPRKLDDLAKVSPEFPEIIAHLAPREVKLQIIDNEGTPVSYAITTTFFNAGGKELKLVSFKNIQSALEENESDAWRKLIRVLTHEMMNSITPIISLSETLSEEQPEMNEKHYTAMTHAMQTIHRRSKGLVDFVKNYQQLTRIPEPVPANIPVSEMLSDISRLLKADGIEFAYHVVPDDIQLFADRAQMEQILINLIKNAWEACLNFAQPDVKIDVYKNEYQKPVIVISDNGCGIVPEALDKVFVPFFTTKTGGSGIGLSICRQIMNLHHGNISIESEVDKGTKVALRF